RVAERSWRQAPREVVQDGVPVTEPHEQNMIRLEQLEQEAPSEALRQVRDAADILTRRQGGGDVLRDTRPPGSYRCAQVLVEVRGDDPHRLSGPEESSDRAVEPVGLRIRPRDASFDLLMYREVLARQAPEERIEGLMPPSRGARGLLDLPDQYAEIGETRGRGCRHPGAGEDDQLSLAVRRDQLIRQVDFPEAHGLARWKMIRGSYDSSVVRVIVSLCPGTTRRRGGSRGAAYP